MAKQIKYAKEDFTSLTLLTQISNGDNLPECIISKEEIKELQKFTNKTIYDDDDNKDEALSQEQLDNISKVREILEIANK